MGNSDTIKLLRECDAGSKMAVTSIDDVMDKVKDAELLRLLRESKDHHSKLGNELHALINQQGADEKEPPAIAKSMSWMKTNMKTAMHDDDATIADLITEGCNMGVKSICKYMNQYQTADESSKKIAERLIQIEEELRLKIQKYL